ncbi:MULTISPECIES: hypothetical protein [unclassified Methanoregula]|uniref:hypothetical protein n=1 Tax=unclassified Methanoregula TaxID=2649730 RepID=UPI0009C67EE6|nr:MULTISPECIES: hypothetical protein [unclassified Methanoregula]OPX64277.1 MAG: hypothetical protein A4E33_01306 [Methanoregula sp. PtaB.Bin085]OPY33598.1 MAG: hypothetical protein A4E34_01921 [Methanoregula sp. PtaU1.Bin006]
MRPTALVLIIILVTGIVPGAVLAAETTPIYPGKGDSDSDFYGRYPMAKSNTAIMGFIGECGLGRWHEEHMGAYYKSVHLAAANSCGKQLIFEARKGAARDDPTQITDVWIIGANETWSGSMIPVNARKTPGFVVPGAFVAIAICAALFIRMRRNR